MLIKEILHMTCEVELEVTQEEFDEAQVDMEENFNQLKARIERSINVKITNFTHETVVASESVGELND